MDGVYFYMKNKVATSGIYGRFNAYLLKHINTQTKWMCFVSVVTTLGVGLGVGGGLSIARHLNGHWGAAPGSKLNPLPAQTTPVNNAPEVPEMGG